MKTLFMETTKIPVGETVGQIQRLLAAYGVTGIMLEYKDKEVASVCFKIIFIDKDIPFRLPCRWEAIYTILLKRRKKLRDGMVKELEDQAKRVAWRQVLRWIEAQLALVDTEMVKLPEVFTPYIQVGINGETLYQKIEAEKFKSIGYKPTATEQAG